MSTDTDPVAERVRSLEQTLLFVAFLASVGVGAYLLGSDTVMVGKLWLEFGLVFGLLYMLNLVAKYAPSWVHTWREWRAA